jgi:peroxiredoxin
MAKTESTMLALGSKAPDFKLLDAVSNKVLSLDELRADNKPTVIMFICNHCPYVIHIQIKLAEVAKSYAAKGVKFIAISANDVDEYPADSVANMKIEAETHHYTFPYLYDETQAVAKLYHAACTPDFYIFDHDLMCVYCGRFDDATPGKSVPVTGKDLCSALDILLNHEKITAPQIPSIGCNIKWKK